MKRNRHGLASLLRGVFFPATVVTILICFTTALNRLSEGRNEEDLRQLEEALRRGCVACYAAEGAYPPSLDYLKEHYGLQIDETRYIVFYSGIAENLMPDITILESRP